MQWIADDQIADDIIQDVFLKIHEKIDSLREADKVRSWVLQITRNTIIDHFRNNRLILDDIGDHPEIFEPVPIKITDSNERDLKKEIEEGLLTLIGSLPAKYAQALIMVEYDGLTQVELARRLKISVPGAKSRIQRARKMVKDRLLNCCHYEFDRYGTVVGIKPDDCGQCC